LLRFFFAFFEDFLWRFRLLELREDEEVEDLLDLLFFSCLDGEVLAFFLEGLRPRSGSPCLEG
jgi:hypothetical protein